MIYKTIKMGGSSSSATTYNENNQTIVNKNTMDLLNKQINTAIAKTRINNSTGCKNTVKQSQMIDFSNCRVGGDMIFDGINMDQTTEVVDFTCVQASKVDNEMAQEIMGEIMGKINSGLDSESLNKMISYAEAEASQGFLAAPWGGADSSTSSTNIYNLDVKNDNRTNIRNIVKNSIETEFNVDDVQECVNEVVQEQGIKARNCRADGSLVVKNVDFNQGVATTAECIQSKGISQKITNTAGNVLGVVVEADTKSVAKTDMDARGTAISEVSGIDDVFGASFESFGTSAASLGMGPAASCLLCCCCIICIAIIAGLFYLQTDEGQEFKGDVRAGRDAFKASRSARRG
jgi:hypothetical protein